MLVRLFDETSRDKTRPFLGDPMDMMKHNDNIQDHGDNGLNSSSQAPMFTADQLQAMHRQSQQRSNNYTPNQPSTSSQFLQGTNQQYSSSMNDTMNQNWMQLLQPTPLGNQQNANHPSSSTNMEMQIMLQQLFQNQQNQEGNVNNQTQSNSLFTLGSTVEPMHHRNTPDSDPDPDFFKSMWDVEDTTLPGLRKPPSLFQHSKPATKRKWTKNGGTAKKVVPQKTQQRQYEHIQNPAALHNFSDPIFSFPNDAMDDTEDFPLQYGNCKIREESPMSTSSGAGIPPSREILPASCVSSSRGISEGIQQQQIAHMEDSNAVSRSEEDYAFLLPSTLLPPSVMASVLYPGHPAGLNTNNKVSASFGGGKYKKKQGTKSTRLESPLDALQRILTLQGYGPIARITAEDAQYETVPSPLQLASFGTELVKAIHASDTQQLSKLLKTGLSPNPCNKFRDSMVDLVCKRANGEIFKCLVSHGCDLRVCDGFGRTPLHHCCWANEFSAVIAETILEIDWLQLFIEDKRGQIPLEYVRPDQAAEWIEFLEDNRQRFFPVGGTASTLHAVKDYRPDNVLPDPPNALPIDLASAISSGRLTPDELANMDPVTRARFFR